MRHTFAHRLTAKTATAAKAAATHLTRRAVLVATALLAGTAQAAIVYSSSPVQFGTNQTLTLGSPGAGPTLVNQSWAQDRYDGYYDFAEDTYVSYLVGSDYNATFNFSAKVTGKFTETTKSVGDVVDLNAGFTASPLAEYRRLVYGPTQEFHPSSGLYGFKFRNAAISGTPWLFGWMDLSIAFDEKQRDYDVTIHRFAFDDSGASIAVGVTSAPLPDSQPADEVKPPDEPVPTGGPQGPAAAVPEPGSLALLALALGALGWTRRHGASRAHTRRSA